MEFFQTFWSHLDTQLQTYISDNAGRVAAALTPIMVFLATLYIMMWGYLHLTGKIDEPFTAGLKRILTLAIVLALCLQLWLYNDLLVDTFYTAPTQLAQAVIRPAAAPAPADTVSVVDDIWAKGSAVAQNLWDVDNDWTWDWDFWLAGAFVWLVVGGLCTYTIFLLALSKVALAVLLALGPFFIIMLLFETSSRYFMAWIGQLANYALVTVLTTMVCALFLQTVQTYADKTAALGSAILTTDVLDLLLMCGLAFLFMMQVPQVAASLASGGSPLDTRGAFTRVPRAAAKGVWKTGGFIRGFRSTQETTTAQRSEWSPTRRAGHAFKKSIGGLISRKNSIEVKD